MIACILAFGVVRTLGIAAKPIVALRAGPELFPPPSRFASSPISLAEEGGVVLRRSIARDEPFAIASLAGEPVLAQKMNTLTPAEIRDGWQLLFDGTTTNGWHNFRKQGVGPGWQVQDGILTSVDPATAGDIVTDEKFDWFVIELDFRLTKGGNSGVMIHCADDEGDYMWFSGPEIQIYDDHGEPGAQKTGYLYDLYSSPVDSTKPPGQWNHFKIVVAPRKCETYVNGVKYYEYEPGSKDFWDRVAKSKFAAMPMFAKLQKGTIGIQGDHGTVSFRNIKIRPLRLGQ